MFGVGALLTTVPVSPAVIASALQALHEDADRDPSAARYTRLAARLDEGTLARGHFHASEDSANGHSHLARAIAEHVTGNFTFSFGDLSAGANRAAYRRHALRALYTSCTRVSRSPAPLSDAQG